MKTRGWKTIEAAARARGRELGFKGAQGGWIYRTSVRPWKPICQGWYLLGKRLLRQGLLVLGQDGRYMRGIGWDAVGLKGA